MSKELAAWLDELEEAAKASPLTRSRPGWRGWPECLYLGALLDESENFPFHCGMMQLMDFARWGMKDAQPRFLAEGDAGVMVPARDLLKFEVGDPGITGLDAGKANHTVYRLTVDGIDHPIARLIALAVDTRRLLELIAEYRRLSGQA